ncbi:hypothetical protein [Streptomyces bluensis]|uniref:hypothetical protein n=1 Tax=Streptomyces bluensis TaxID=33897 RepID=UPI00199038A0|nr:hypothetical protein [Streptomyces bluensis]GGZ87130.1 hypothetical protein GCM10010344_63380 [Streptomyces bluensis]
MPAPLPVPLPVSDPEVGNGVRALSGNPAIALFTDRVAAMLPGFAVTVTVTVTESDAAAERVRRLDGLPFAIEAANRSASRTVLRAPGFGLSYSGS